MSRFRIRLFALGGSVRCCGWIARYMENITPGSSRTKFRCHHVGTIPRSVTDLYGERIVELSNALRHLEELGVAPVMPDGKVAGNGAVSIQNIRTGALAILVSQSGRKPCQVVSAANVCMVTAICIETWSVTYYSASECVRPSSDTPLLWSALTGNFGWCQSPIVALHGHALASDEDAKRLKLPISPVETPFSTVEDVKALENLFRKFVYPDADIYIRKGHGFFALAQTARACLSRIQSILPQSDEPDRTCDRPV